MFCAKCGKNASDNSRFCAVCGSPLVAQELTKEPAPPSKGNKKLIIVLVAAAAVLLLAAGIGAFVLLNMLGLFGKRDDGPGQAGQGQESEQDPAKESEEGAAVKLTEDQEASLLILVIAMGWNAYGWDNEEIGRLPEDKAERCLRFLGCALMAGREELFDRIVAQYPECRLDEDYGIFMPEASLKDFLKDSIGENDVSSIKESCGNGYFRQEGDGYVLIPWDSGDAAMENPLIEEAVLDGKGNLLLSGTLLERSSGEETLHRYQLKLKPSQGSIWGGYRLTEVVDWRMEDPAPAAKAKTDVNIDVRQVDNAAFPAMTLYASIQDQDGNIPTGITKADFSIQEIDVSGNVRDVAIDEIFQASGKANVSLELVLDASASMLDANKMLQAKNAALALISQMALEKGDRAEVISFGDFVYLEQGFTSQRDALVAAVNNVDTYGNTALYDAIYTGLYQSYSESGAKCVIAFTDGEENASSYTYDDVVRMAQNTGIPVYIIGIGGGYDAARLQSLTDACSGKYYSADVSDLEAILKDIYLRIYQDQQGYYVVKYTSPDLSNPTEFRKVVLQATDAGAYSGSYTKSYVPQADVSGAFSGGYANKSYILDFSSQRKLSDADLRGLSLAELRIARNEIFARHGRQFKDPFLNQWFYSKAWYLALPAKYAPDVFDAISPNPLSKLEQENTEFIRNYENALMGTSDIYPNASNEILSEYDLALSKNVLKTALAQMQRYTGTDILRENIRRVQEAIDRADVSY